MRNELGRAKWLLLSALIFLMSACVSWGEVVYLVVGQHAQGRVERAYEVTRRSRLGLHSKRLVVEFTFTEGDGTRRKGSDTLSVDWPVPADGVVAIQYTAGVEGSSRVAGHVNWVALTIFTLSLLAMGGFGYHLWQEASEATRDRKPSYP